MHRNLNDTDRSNILRIRPDNTIRAWIMKIPECFFEQITWDFTVPWKLHQTVQALSAQ